MHIVLVFIQLIVDCIVSTTQSFPTMTLTNSATKKAPPMAISLAKIAFALCCKRCVMFCYFTVMYEFNALLLVKLCNCITKEPKQRLCPRYAKKL